MSTSKSQRIGIWVIAIVMALGTVSSLLVYALAQKNSSTLAGYSQEEQQKKLDEYMKKIEEEAKKRKETSKPLNGYSAIPFDKSSVKKTTVKVLKQGEGGPIPSADYSVTVNYFGWTGDGKIFDSTNQNGATKPIDFVIKGTVKGFQKGLVGAKKNSVIEITMTEEDGYGSEKQNENTGRPGGPLKFIVEIKDFKETKKENK